MSFVNHSSAFVFAILTTFGYACPCYTQEQPVTQSSTWPHLGTHVRVTPRSSQSPNLQPDHIWVHMSVLHPGAASHPIFNLTTFGYTCPCYTQEQPVTQSSTWPHLGTHVRVTPRSSQSPNLPPGLDHSYLKVLLFHQPITSPMIVLTCKPTCCAGTNSIASDLITMKNWFFFLSIGHQQQSAIFSCDCTMTGIPCAPENHSLFPH